MFRMHQSAPTPRVGIDLNPIDAVSSVLDAAGKVFDAVPGTEWIKGAIASGASLIGTIAQDPKGQFILFAVTNAFLFPGIAGLSIPSVSGMQTVGPVIASLVWALPGVAAGDGFTESYASELTWRTMKLIQIIGGQAGTDAANSFNDGIKSAINDSGLTDAIATIKPLLQGLSQEKAKEAVTAAGLDPAAIAKKKNIRADSAGASINALAHKRVYDLDRDFDINGKLTSVVLGLPTPAPEPAVTIQPVSSNLINAAKQLARAEAAYAPGLRFDASNTNQGVFAQLFTAVVLTAPAWGTLYYLARTPRKR